MKLTDTRIKAAKARDKEFTMGDGDGLFLLVKPTGGKLWRFRFMFEGRPKLMSFGSYPEVPLALARERRKKARAQVAESHDPVALRQESKAGRVNTFEAIAAEWLEHKEREGVSAGTRRRDWDRLRQFVHPYLGKRPISALTAPDFLAVLRRIEERGTVETAHRTRSACGQVLRYAIATGRAKSNVVADLKGALARPVASNHAALTDPKRIGELLRAIDGYQGQPSVMAALKLAPLVFVRPGELRAAEWKEIDLDNAVWRIPAERMKMKEQHIVPLARQSVVILRDIERHTCDGRFVFPSTISTERPMSDNTITSALRRMGYSGDEQTGHGFRTIASTLLNELGFHPDLIELQLAHQERNRVRAAYNKAQRLDERRKMMQSWADHLDELRSSGEKKPAKASRRAAKEHRA